MESMTKGCGVKHGSKSNIWAVNLLLLVLVLSVFRIMVAEAAASDSGFYPNSEHPCSLKDPAMDPTHEVRYGRDVVWQIPPSPKAVLLLAHGRAMESLQFFDPGPNCKQCYGMPECRTAVLESFQRRYAIIAVTSNDSEPRDVTSIVKEWTTQHSLDRLPLTAWGHSGGTYLVTALTGTLPLRAIVLMCGEGNYEVESMATARSFPPTLFVVMPRDAFILDMPVTELAEKAMAMLLSRGVEVAETQCWPKPLSPLFFTEHILCMSEQMSRTIYAALDAAGWIDSNGYLTRNPDTEDFESVLLKANALPYCVVSGDLCLIAQVKEELKAAFAVHSFTSDANGVIFPWLDSHILPSSAGEGSDFQSPALTAGWLETH